MVTPIPEYNRNPFQDFLDEYIFGLPTEKDVKTIQPSFQTATAKLGGIAGTVLVDPKTGKAIEDTWVSGDFESPNPNSLAARRSPEAKKMRETVASLYPAYNKKLETGEQSDQPSTPRASDSPTIAGSPTGRSLERGSKDDTVAGELIGGLLDKAFDRDYIRGLERDRLQNALIRQQFAEQSSIRRSRERTRRELELQNMKNWADVTRAEIGRDVAIAQAAQYAIASTRPGEALAAAPGIMAGNGKTIKIQPVSSTATSNLTRGNVQPLGGTIPSLGR